MLYVKKEKVAVAMKRRKIKPINVHLKKEKKSKQKEELAFIAGPSYDFWNSEGDSIYDKLYGTEKEEV